MDVLVSCACVVAVPHPQTGRWNVLFRLVCILNLLIKWSFVRLMQP